MYARRYIDVHGRVLPPCLIETLGLCVSIGENSVEAVIDTIKPGRIAQSGDHVGAFIRNNRCGKADHSVLLCDYFVMFQNIIAGVGVRPKVFHLQQTVLHFEFLGASKCMHIEVTQFPEIVRPHIGSERNGGGTDRFM